MLVLKLLHFLFVLFHFFHTLFVVTNVLLVDVLQGRLQFLALLVASLDDGGLLLF